MRLIPQSVRSIFSRKPPTQAPHARKFLAARIDRFSADWFATETSLNEELRGDLNLLRRRGRDLVNNNDYARKFRRMCENNIVGPTGFRLQVRVENKPGVPDELANTAIESAWDEWKHTADITGQLHFDQLCETLIGSMPADGEFLVRIVRGADAKNKFNFALQVIDVDRLDTWYNMGATQGGNAIIMGVEVDPYRRPVAYWMFTHHPNDGIHTSRQRVRIPADEILHRFKIERSEQLRGIPWMAPGMLSLHHLGAFKLSALLAAEHGANHYGFFTTPDGQSPIGATDATTNEQITTSQPGTYDTLPTGVTFTPHQSKYPDTAFGPFVKTTLQRIASGWCIAYHSLANDLEGVNFSSIRSGTLEERDRWAADQQWFINVFLEVVYAEWLKFALMSGAILMPNGSALPAAKLAKFSAHEWQPRKWDWVDPKNDMEAHIIAMRGGLRSPQNVAAALGEDFEDNLKQIQQAQKLADKYGVHLPAYDANPGVQSGAKVPAM